MVGTSERECNADVEAVVFLLLWSSGPMNETLGPQAKPLGAQNMVLHSDCAHFPSVFLQGLFISRVATPSDSKANPNTSLPLGLSMELSMSLKQVPRLQQQLQGTIPSGHHRLAYDDQRPIWAHHPLDLQLSRLCHLRVDRLQMW